MSHTYFPQAAQAIRERIHLHPRATTRDIIASLAMDEIEVSVYQVRDIMREVADGQSLSPSGVPATTPLGMQRGFAS
ncbi:MAG TPA: hypothetical protein VJ783_02960 [Pirellulales bacterium]|nr:hypothetical protein [Pirellulales bacterium]